MSTCILKQNSHVYLGTRYGHRPEDSVFRGQNRAPVHSECSSQAEIPAEAIRDCLPLQWIWKVRTSNWN